MISSWDFACPACRNELHLNVDELSMRCANPACPAGAPVFSFRDGIWRCLLPEQQEHFRRFMDEYETVRRREGRGHPSAEYYRALPFEDLSGNFSNDWRIRAISFQTMLHEVVIPLERYWQRPLSILDLGAGNCWLSARLVSRGHWLAAIDLLDNPSDGLGAWIHYPQVFTPIQASYSSLPLQDHQSDLIIYNASFHYAESFINVLREGLRLLRNNGRLVIMDSPTYHDRKSGVRMVQERQSYFKERFGFPSDAIASEEFITYERMYRIGAVLGINWQHIAPKYGFGWKLRPLLAALRRSREPAELGLWVGKVD